MCVLILSATFVFNVSHSKKNSARYHHKCTRTYVRTQVLKKSTHYSLQIEMKLEFSRQILEKCDGRTDGQT